jgi:hypothetical protein
MSAIKAYYFKSRSTGKERNTAVLAESADAARAKLRRPAPKDAVVVAVRSLQPEEAKGGKWSRIRKDGKTPAKSAYGKGRGYGPRR